MILMLTEDVEKKLIERLKKIDPAKIILFGSQASGDANNDSDIDLLVVTQDEFLPQNFAEKNAIYLRVSNAITDLEKMLPIDLIVHTKSMHQKFIEMGSMFSKQIIREGRILYEKTH